ncbi:von Willebrand factor A domain-containing protein 5B2 isoform X3 [Hyla sarda]|nr:von Willebrand factor A domain-containing protein 5B2 isoform X3 [Hyla sarda]XP_056421597.1 von Willebrand factor A domain-containing protein 5B2 isoform X3 [Hyla sarda]XP_056421598.1 von Willebrand factor A domain-containing protein 5B2 isoform X3 [Hyla sarda]
MPGLYDTASWVQLPLEASCVNACANGFSLGINAQLTYLNTCSDTVQAMFIYLLEKGEVVTSFEAVTGNRKVQAQVQSQIRMEECCSGCHWESLPCYCPNGHLVLDPDTAHSVFVLSVGSVHPSAVVSVTLQSSRELQTLPGGAVRVTLNSTLTPMALNPGDPSEHGDGLCDDRLCSCPASCFGGVSGTGASPWVLLTDSPSQTLAATRHKSLSTALTGLATNPQCYHFSFRLQVQGPCLLAGIESPSHALRADASPFAVSASSIWISLAEEYNCDRALEIILHPSEPHLPHLCLERGIKTFQQYEMHIKERKDFIKAMKKSSDPERQVNFVRRRFHKDLHLNPVLMLNFCPDITALSSFSSGLPTVTREVIFIVHLMEDSCHNIRDALLLAVRSLPARTLLNVAGGTCDNRALFPTSRQCTNDSLEMACEFFRSNKLCGISSNIPSVLGRILAHPVHRGYPRQLFIITDSGFSNSSRVLELLRHHAKTTRVFGFGVGSNGDHKILERAAKLTRGTVELISEGERLQPKLIKSLKKALEPVLSDITIDWYMPETMEALLTPNDIAPLYPGDSLISYCTLYNTAIFRSKKGPTRVARGGSLSSVFQSQEESQTPGTTDTSYPNQSAGMEDVEKALQEISHEISMEFSAWSEDPERTESIGGDGAHVSDIRKRIVRSSYVQEQYMLTHCSISTEPTQPPTQPSMCSDPTRATSHGSTSSESVGSRETVSGDCITPYSRKASQQGKKSFSHSEGMYAFNQNSTPSCKATVTQSAEELVRRKALIQATMSGRSFSSPLGELDMLRLRTVLDRVSQRKDSEDVNAKITEGLCDSLAGQLPSPAQLDWDMLVDAQYLFSASPAAANIGSGVSSDSGWQCRAVIHGYIGSSNYSWETTISLEPLINGIEEDFGTCTEYEKCYDLHQLAARSVIQDNEDMAWRECDIEHGSSRRFRLKAIQTSKSCSQVSVFTSHLPIDLDTQDALPGHMIVRRGGRSRRSGSSNSGSWSVADTRHSEIMEDTFENAARSPVLLSSQRISSENGLEKREAQEGQIISQFTSQKSDSSVSSRVSVGKKKIRNLSGKLSPLKPCLTGNKEPKSELLVQDYLPLISLQTPDGFFNLSSCFSSVVQISLQRLLRASPFSCHRGSLSPVSEPCPLEHGDFIRGAQTCKGGSQPQVPESKDTSSLPIYATSCPEALCHQADSGRGSETDPCDNSPCPSETGNELDTDLEGCSWATAVALAWLEHRCAGFFIEWELLAAKAEGWLTAQMLPDGLQLPALKGAARQLFLLLRHWDENLNLKILCYKPGDV